MADRASESAPPLPALRVDVAALRRHGQDRHRVDAELGTEWLSQVLSATDATVRGPGRVAATILLPADGAVFAQGELTLRFEVPCGRCLEPAVVDGSSAFEATFVEGAELPGPSGEPGRDEEEEPGIGLSGEDLDTWLFDGTAIALDRVVAEQVRLAYPMRALCRLDEACRGLCRRCGASLNEGTTPGCSRCGASEAVATGAGGEEEESPLAAALKKIRLPE